jgi:RNA polymerase sigma-70 factor, ECF subfamily
MSETDTALVVRARDGDRAAFEALVRRTSRLVYARLYLDAGRRDRVEDLLQETYLRAFRAVRWLDDAAGFRPWLLTIAHNVLIDDARQAARLKRKPPTADNYLAALPSPEPAPDEAAERAELRQRVLSVLRSLPAEYQMPLTLRYIAGADHDAIGEQLGLTDGSLRGLLHRGLKMLRDRLPPDIATAFEK